MSEVGLKAVHRITFEVERLGAGNKNQWISVGYVPNSMCAVKSHAL